MNENEIIDSETLKDAEDTSPQQDNTADEWLANIRHNRPEVHTVPSNLPELSLYGLDNRPVPKSANSFRTKETKSGECAETPLGTVQIEPKGNITLHFHNGDSITFCTNGELLKNGELVKTAKADMSTLRDGGATGAQHSTHTLMEPQYYLSTNLTATGELSSRSLMATASQPQRWSQGE